MFQCMHEAVDRLENPEQRPAAEVRARYARWVHDFSKRLKTDVPQAKSPKSLATTGLEGNFGFHAGGYIVTCSNSRMRS